MASTPSTQPQRSAFTVSGVDPLFGQRVNCGSYYTLGEAIAYVDRHARSATSREYAHRIHLTPLGYALIDDHLVIWESVRRQPKSR